MRRALLISIVTVSLGPTACKQTATESSQVSAELGKQQKGEAAGLEYLYAAPEQGAKQQGLLVLLHGSSASSYNTFIGEMRTIATDNDLIPVSVLAPNKSDWLNVSEQERQAGGDALDELIQSELYSKFDIDKNRVFFSGQSSGGGFLSVHFVPKKANKYTGGAFLQCGVQAPREQPEGSAEDHKRFAVHARVDQGDSWGDYFDGTESYYKQAGFAFQGKRDGNLGHCGWSQADEIGENLQWMESTIEKQDTDSSDATSSGGPSGQPETDDKGRKVLGT